MRKYFVVLSLLLSMTMPVLGQLNRGSITGTVSDSAANRITSVDIVATNIATGVHFSTISNETGIYTLQNLPLGTYSVVYRKDGFVKYKREGVIIAVGEVARLDVVLEVGAVTNTVTVTANASVLQTEDTAVGQDMTSNDFRDLPISAEGGRSADEFVYAFTPMVTGGVAAAGSFAGAQGYTKAILIDGTSVDAFAAGWLDNSSPSPEAVEEFKVDTAGITAEAGRTGGGVESFSLKSGTNHWHGSAAYFYGNKFLNANTWDNDWWIAYQDATDPNAAQDNLGYAKAVNTYNSFAVSGGGPIWKNKTFFYVAYEPYTQPDWQLGWTGNTVPTAAFLKGDFSALLNTGDQLTDPNTGLPAVDSAGNAIYSGAIWNPATQDVFPGNIIPTGQLSNMSKAIASIYSTDFQPVNSNLSDNYPTLAKSWAMLSTQKLMSVKLDQVLTANQHLSGSIIYTDQNTTSSSDLWQYTNHTNGGPFAGGVVAAIRSPQYRLQHAYNIKPTMLNVLSLTYSQDRDSNANVNNAEGGGANLAQLGFPAGTPEFPTFWWGGLNGVNETSLGQGWTPNHFQGYNSTLDNTFTWTKGRHILKFGGEVRDQMMSDGNDKMQWYYFNSNTGIPLSSGSAYLSQTGFGFANMMLGDVDTAGIAVNDTQHSRRWVYGLFAEDNIKVNSKLTVDLGLRWDANSRLHELDGRWANFDVNVPNPVFNGLKGNVTYLSSPSDSFETNENYLQFGPHLGAAYQIYKKLVLRGSFGMYYAPLEMNGYHGTPYGYQANLAGVDQVNDHSDHSVTFQWDQNPYPGVFQPGSTSYTVTTLPQTATYIDPDTTTMGRTQNWNLGGQYEIARDMRLEVGYIGNIGRKLHDGSLSPTPLTPWATYSQYTTAQLGGHISDAADALALGMPYPYPGFVGSGYQAINPFPQVTQNGGMYVADSPIGRTKYNALLVDVLAKRRAASPSISTDTLQDGRGNTQTAFAEPAVGSSAMFKMNPVGPESRGP